MPDVIDMHDVGLLRDPVGEYSRIRDRAPLVRAVQPGVDPVWLVTRYDDVKTVFTSPRFVNDPANVPGMRLPSLGEQIVRAQDVPTEYMKYRLLRMDAFDGTEHIRLRRLVSRAFTTRRIRGLRPRVEEIADELLDGLPGLAREGVVDLIPHFAGQLPSMVLSELVGIPKEDRPRWQEWYAVASPVTGRQQKAQAWRELVPYLQELIEQRRAAGEAGADDLISAMVSTRDEEGDRLSEVEMIAMLVTLGLTGPQTDATFIGNAILALLTHPDQLALLRRDPGLMPRAVHELLRWCSPAIAPPRMRYAIEDIEIGGMPIRKGEAVWLVLAGANHDPRRFDDPDRLDITRQPDARRESHVAFGYGLHHCLGAAVVRQDAEVALAAVLRRFPGLALAADPNDLEIEMLPSLWRLTTLPVRLW